MLCIRRSNRTEKARVGKDNKVKNQFQFKTFKLPRTFSLLSKVVSKAVSYLQQENLTKIAVIHSNILVIIQTKEISIMNNS